MVIGMAVVALSFGSCSKQGEITENKFKEGVWYAEEHKFYINDKELSLTDEQSVYIYTAKDSDLSDIYTYLNSFPSVCGYYYLDMEEALGGRLSWIYFYEDNTMKWVDIKGTYTINGNMVSCDIDKHIYINGDYQVFPTTFIIDGDYLVYSIAFNVVGYAIGTDEFPDGEISELKLDGIEREFKINIYYKWYR